MGLLGAGGGLQAMQLLEGAHILQYSTSAQPECLLQTACCMCWRCGERLCCHARRQHVGVDDLDWRAIAGHLGRSQQAVRSKYRHQKVTQDGSGHRAPAAVGVRKSITYGSMAVAGLCALPDQVGAWMVGWLVW